MLSTDKILSFLKSNLPIFEKEYGISKIGLFGSFARNQQTANSDVDLILEFFPNTKDLFNKKEKLRVFIKSNLGCEVDLCREKYLKDYAKETLLKDAIYVRER